MGWVVVGGMGWGRVPLFNYESFLIGGCKDIDF